MCNQNFCPGSVYIRAYVSVWFICAFHVCFIPRRDSVLKLAASPLVGPCDQRDRPGVAVAVLLVVLLFGSVELH